ncbi:MAG: S8 family serine peptidase [Mycobacteriales bacterium]|nr:S8 family serine peptidase [Mycobacteriales bacterium]
MRFVPLTGAAGLLAVALSATPSVAQPERPQAGAAGSARFVLSVAPGFDTGALPAGVTVARELTAVGAVVVDAAPADLLSLRSVPGVRGVAPDRMLSVAGNGGKGEGVLAPTAVGGTAGQGDAGSGVTVAVIDTGVADTALLTRESGRLVDGADTSGEGDGPRDGHGHGTFMANLVAGGKWKGMQVGVAPAARVVDVKVATADGSTSLSRVLDGFDWVVQNRARLDIDVVSLSLSAARPEEGYGRDPLTDGAERLRDAGIVVAVATGNDPSQVGDPGQDPLLMAVGAADTTQTAASTASFSGSAVVAGLQRPDLVAPGVSVLSVLPPSSRIAQSNPEAQTDSGLWSGSGTSQATAVAAGAVAVFLSGREGLSPDDVRVSFAHAASPLSGTADGAGLLRIPTEVRRAADQPAWDGSGTAGEPAPTATSWSATSWSASSWSATSWSATSWSATSWSATSWSATSWSLR